MLDFIVGFGAALLSGLGIGGGGLLVIWLVIFCEAEQIAAQGINLIWFIFSSLAAMTVHLIKRSLNFKLIFWLVLWGSIGAVIGSRLTNVIPTDIIRTCFGILLIGSGVITLFRRQ